MEVFLPFTSQLDSSSQVASKSPLNVPKVNLLPVISNDLERLLDVVPQMMMGARNQVINTP